MKRSDDLAANSDESRRALTQKRSAGMDRRSFIKLSGLAGGGLALAFSLDARSALSELAAMADSGDDTALTFNAYIQVSTEGPIYVHSVSPEIGQGIKTAFAMIVAEELDADWDDVRPITSAASEELYGFQEAGGSTSIRKHWDVYRQSAAAVKAMLVAAAAERWQVPASAIETADSHLSHAASGRRAHYAEFAESAAAQSIPDTNSLTLKARGDYQLIGSRVSGVENLDVVTGRPLFGIDQVLPGMVYASYTKCPATGGRVVSANLDEIRQMPGVQDAFVIDGTGIPDEVMSGVAVIADSTFNAFQAKKALSIEWDESEASTENWTDMVATADRLLSGGQGTETVRRDGNPESVFESAPDGRVIEARYTFPFVTHAPLEPQNATVWYRDGDLDLWAPTQTPTDARKIVAKVLGIDVARVTLHNTRVGGGFGRRLMNDYCAEAAAIARRVDGPVKLQWTREDDMAHDFYRVGGFNALKGAIDDDGKLTAWSNHFIAMTNNGERPVYGGSISDREFPASAINNYLLTQDVLPLKIPCGWWRAPGANTIAWTTQSFIHELSHLAGRDHLEFLLELMAGPGFLEAGNDRTIDRERATGVIKLAAEKAGWGRSLPAGRGLGLAFHFSHRGHVAEVAEVSVDENKKLTVHNVMVAADVGPVVNLSGAEAQCEGSVIDGMSTMLGLEVTMKDGRIEQSNFHQYPLLRCDKAPTVASHFIQSDHSPTGLGEPALPPVAPAICNAIFAASGHRVRTLPLTKEGFSV